MKKALVLMLSVVLLTSFSLMAASKADQEVHAALLTYRQALVKKDIAALKQIWSDDYTFVNSHGEVHTKADRLADLTSGHTSLESIKHEDEPTIRIHGNTAIVTSLVTITGKYSGHEVSSPFRSVHVWINEDGRWQLVANQLTPIAK